MFDADCMMEMMQKTMNKIGQEGNAVVVGRGAPYLLRENPDAFHVFLYAPRAEKIRRIMAEGHSEEDAAEQVDSVDRERMAYVKHYFNADWPTRSLYHVMLNTAVGNEPVCRPSSTPCIWSKAALKPRTTSIQRARYSIAQFKKPSSSITNSDEQSCARARPVIYALLTGLPAAANRLRIGRCGRDSNSPRKHPAAAQ
jgi:hypothetical protein